MSEDGISHLHRLVNSLNLNEVKCVHSNALWKGPLLLDFFVIPYFDKSHPWDGILRKEWASEGVLHL